MDNISGNNLLTPIKSKSISFNIGPPMDNSDSSLSGIYGQDSPNSKSRDSLSINVSFGESNNACVTSTPVSRTTAPLRKSSIFKTKRYSLKSEYDNKRVDISGQVKILEDCRNNIENISNDIHMSHLQFKYSRLNPIYKDLNEKEENIYLYPIFFNSDMMTSKFVSQTKLSKNTLIKHRYDNEQYILKMGDYSSYTLSPLNRMIINEIQILKLIGSHPNIVEYCDSWIEENKLHLQLKYVPTASLKEFLIHKSQLLDAEAVFLSYMSGAVLLAQMGSVLLYLHESLCVYHGAISTNHILVEHVNYFGDINNNKESDKLRCYKALESEEYNMDLRFKLCDFSKSKSAEGNFQDEGTITVQDDDLRDGDILLLGMTLLDSFCGVIFDLQNDERSTLLNRISTEWNYIITNLCHKDAQHRWTARSILAIDGIDKFILPEARVYMPQRRDDIQDSLEPSRVKFVKQFNNEATSHMSVCGGDNYWIKSANTNQMIDVTNHVQSLNESCRIKHETLDDIHNKYLKFKDFKFSVNVAEESTQEKCIFDYPILFNSEIVATKFSSRSIISERKLSLIYLAYHRYDGDSYILKVGLESMTVMISDSSREIINEMKILKLIGKHPNVVGYCDCWIEQEKFHLQLEYIGGGSLYDFTLGNYEELIVLSDTTKRSPKLYISAQSAYVLLAHIVSALVYFHDELQIFHGDIKPSNILVGLAGCNKACECSNNGKYLCHNLLAGEDGVENLRFKLCDFGRSGLTENILSVEEGDGRYLPNLSEIFADSDYHIRATSRDIYSLGLTIYDCFGGQVDQDSVRDIRVGQWRDWPDRVTGEWRDIIMNLSHIDPMERLTAREVIVFDKVLPFILPEAKYHFRSSDRYIKSTCDIGSFADLDSRPQQCSREQSQQEDMEYSF